MGEVVATRLGGSKDVKLKRLKFGDFKSPSEGGALYHASQA